MQKLVALALTCTISSYDLDIEYYDITKEDEDPICYLDGNFHFLLSKNLLLTQINKSIICII